MTILGIALVLVAIGAVYGIHRWYAHRIEQNKLNRHAREIAQCYLLPHYQFSWNNMHKYPWIKWNMENQEFDIRSDVSEWLSENCPKSRIGKDQGDVFLAFHTKDDQFHFKMRWM